MEPPWLDDLADDLQSISFNSTTTTTDINRSTSSESEATWTTGTSSSRQTTTKLQATSSLSLADIYFIQRLGAGDIGSVYLAKLKCSSYALFAAKVIDKNEIASRNKEGRATTEREILEILDHPFLPKLYASLDSAKWSCLLTEFCPGGDLHVLRQRQPCKRFPESAVRDMRDGRTLAIAISHLSDEQPFEVVCGGDQHRTALGFFYVSLSPVFYSNH